MNTEPVTSNAKTRVLILGGGFCGLYAALHLDKIFAKDPDVEVTLVSRENFLLFTPMLPEVVAGEIDLADIVSPLRQMLKKVRLVIAEVEAIDLTKRQVTIGYGVQHHQKVLSCDHLLIAVGSETGFFNLPGVEAIAVTMKTLGDAFVLRNRTLAMLETANLEDDVLVRRALLTFVVAGGGFAGVETVGALNDFLREAIRYYPNLREEDLRVVLIHAAAILLPELNESLGQYAHQKLEDRHVEIRTETSVTGYSDRGVEVGSDVAIPARTLIWTAGVTSPAVLQALPCRKEKNRIVVDQFLEVPDFPGVWATGDCASVVDPDIEKVHPPTAQHAIREGTQCGKNIAAVIRGERKTPFSFNSLGQLAIIGRRAGVASILGIRISGLPAWCLCRTVYLLKLPRFEQRVRVALGWILELFFPKGLAQHLTLREIDRVQHRLGTLRGPPQPAGEARQKSAA